MRCPLPSVSWKDNPAVTVLHMGGEAERSGQAIVEVARELTGPSLGRQQARGGHNSRHVLHTARKPPSLLIAHPMQARLPPASAARATSPRKGCRACVAPAPYLRRRGTSPRKERSGATAKSSHTARPVQNTGAIAPSPWTCCGREGRMTGRGVVMEVHGCVGVEAVGMPARL